MRMKTLVNYINYTLEYYGKFDEKIYPELNNPRIILDIELNTISNELTNTDKKKK